MAYLSLCPVLARPISYYHHLIIMFSFSIYTGCLLWPVECWSTLKWLCKVAGYWQELEQAVVQVSYTCCIKSFPNMLNGCPLSTLAMQELATTKGHSNIFSSITQHNVTDVASFEDLYWLLITTEGNLHLERYDCKLLCWVACIHGASNWTLWRGQNLCVWTVNPKALFTNLFAQNSTYSIFFYHVTPEGLCRYGLGQWENKTVCLVPEGGERNGALMYLLPPAGCWNICFLGSSKYTLISTFLNQTLTETDIHL